MYFSVHIIYMVFQIALRVRGTISPPLWGGGMMINFAREGIFINWWEFEEWFRLFQLFSKLKATFCKYLTSVKIKSSITYVYNKRKSKIKIVYIQRQWIRLNVKFLLSYNKKTVIQLWGMHLCWEQNKNLVLEEIFL